MISTRIRWVHVMLFFSLLAWGCGDKQKKPDPIPTETNLSCGVAKDPWSAANAWIKTPGTPRAEVQELMSGWETPTVARLWRIEDGKRWKAIIADKPEPAADAPVIVLVLERAPDGFDYEVFEVQTGSATALWPQL